MDGFTAWDALSLGIALLGLILATANTGREFTKRKRKLAVHASWDTAPLGRVDNHIFFVVRMVNLRERPIGIARIEFWNGADMRIETNSFREQPELPATLTDHQEGRVFYDVDYAAGWLVDLGMRHVVVHDAEGKEWPAEIPGWAIEEAREIQEQAPDDEDT